MPKKNTGKEYENFVADLKKAVLDSEKYASHKNIEVQTRKKLLDRNGNNREFDIYWEHEIAGVVYKTVIECKDYTQSVSIEKIDSLIGKINDIPEIDKALFATTYGYQSGAKKKAKKNNIDLLIVRKPQEADWQTEEGIPYLKEIELTINFFFPLEIVETTFLLDDNWMRTNTNISVTEPFSDNGHPTKIFIEDRVENSKKSLRDIYEELAHNEIQRAGQHEIIQHFENAFIHSNKSSYKLSSYSILFNVPEKKTAISILDYNESLIGVIEYLSKDKKFAIFENKIREEDWSF